MSVCVLQQQAEVIAGLAGSPSEDNFNMTVLRTAPVAAVIVAPLASQSAPSYDDAPHS